jgi:hypothetical protein
MVASLADIEGREPKYRHDIKVSREIDAKFGGTLCQTNSQLLPGAIGRVKHPVFPMVIGTIIGLFILRGPPEDVSLPLNHKGLNLPRSTGANRWRHHSHISREHRALDFRPSTPTRHHVKAHRPAINSTSPRPMGGHSTAIFVQHAQSNIMLSAKNGHTAE